MSKLTSTNRSLVLLLFAYPLRLCAQKGTPRYARVSAGKTFNPYSQHAQPVQVRSQLLRIGEMQRMQAGVAAGLDVLQAVVNEHGPRRHQFAAFDCQFEDARIGLR